MKIIILIMALLVSGCIDNFNHGFGYDIDYITQSGIEYRHDSGIVNLLPHEIEQVLIEITECSGLNVPYHNVMVIISDDIDRFGNARAMGVFLDSPNLIVLRSGRYESSRYLVIQNLKHELLHYLQYRNFHHKGNHYDAYFIGCNV